jgi:hypothetical protein
MHSYRAREFQELSIHKIQEFIELGRLEYKENKMITMRDLLESGIHLYIYVYIYVYKYL